MKKLRNMLVLSFFLLSLGGFLLHTRIHHIWVKDAATGLVHFEFEYLLARIGSLAGVVLVTILFLSKKSATTAQVLNGMLCILGTVLMAHFAWVTMQRPLTLEKIILQSTLADILILMAKLFIGQVIYKMKTQFTE